MESIRASLGTAEGPPEAGDAPASRPTMPPTTGASRVLPHRRSHAAVLISDRTISRGARDWGDPSDGASMRCASWQVSLMSLYGRRLTLAVAQVCVTGQVVRPRLASFSYSNGSNPNAFWSPRSRSDRDQAADGSNNLKRTRSTIWHGQCIGTLPLPRTP